MDDREKGENGEGEWLELGLGSNRSTSSTSSPLGSGLGLGLGSGSGSGLRRPSISYNTQVPSLAWLSASPPPPPPPTSSWGFLRRQQTPVSRSARGLWFTLVSYINREGEVLPQVPKAYIKVRDENVTILMVQKYLITKLSLSHEADEIDILCMGEKLPQWHTLRHVRDSVWLPRITESIASTTTAVVGNPGGGRGRDHRSENYFLMSLQYAKRCLFN